LANFCHFTKQNLAYFGNFQLVKREM